MIVTAIKISVEIILSIAIKLMCDNGRINYKDIPAIFGFGADEDGNIEDGFTKEMREQGLDW